MQVNSFLTLLSQATVFSISIETAFSKSNSDKPLLIIESVCLSASSYLSHRVKFSFVGKGINVPTLG